MKRDWNVVRYVLLEVEKKEELNGNLFLNSTYPDSQLAYHLELLIEADLLKGERLELYADNPEYDLDRLTWEGHQFLDSIRDDVTWKRTIKKISDSGVGLTFEIVKSVAISVAKDSLGIS